MQLLLPLNRHGGFLYAKSSNRATDDGSHLQSIESRRNKSCLILTTHLKIFWTSRQRQLCHRKIRRRKGLLYFLPFLYQTRRRRGREREEKRESVGYILMPVVGKKAATAIQPSASYIDVAFVHTARSLFFFSSSSSLALRRQFIHNLESGKKRGANVIDQLEFSAQKKSRRCSLNFGVNERSLDVHATKCFVYRVPAWKKSVCAGDKVIIMIITPNWTGKFGSSSFWGSNKNGRKIWKREWMLKDTYKEKMNSGVNSRRRRKKLHGKRLCLFFMYHNWLVVVVTLKRLPFLGVHRNAKSMRRLECPRAEQNTFHWPFRSQLDRKPQS